MPKVWKRVATLHLEGPRFEDRAVVLSSLKEVLRFQDLVAEAAKGLFREANPGAGRLPNRFEERLTMRFKTVEEGCAALPLEACYEETGEVEVLEGLEAAEGSMTWLERAVELVEGTIEHVVKEEPLPDNLPKACLAILANWGESLQEGEQIGLQRQEGGKVLFVTARERAILQQYEEREYEDIVTVAGKVLAADVRKDVFQLWLDDKKCIEIHFSPEQEASVTEALKEHATMSLCVRGVAELSAIDRKIRGISKVLDLQITSQPPLPFNATAKPIWEELDEIAAGISGEDLKLLPKDGARNLHFYLYGAPKA